jgi:tricorn protease
MSQGYYLFPTVFRDSVVFASEEDLWSVSLEGGVARRLTTGRGNFSRPQFSPDGRWIAASSEEEGAREVVVIPAEGGELKRLTYVGNQSNVVGWDGDDVLFSSNIEEVFVTGMYRISKDGGLAKRLALGPSVHISIAPKGVVLERNSHRPDPSYWKGYRGGTLGRLWVAKSVEDDFSEIRPFEANFSRPTWVKDRIYFAADPDGIAQIYSCDREGKNLKQHSKQKEFYARNPSTDGKTLVYHAGADLFALDLATGRTKQIKVDLASQRTQRQRKFVPASQGFEDYSVSADGQKMAVSVRGKSFRFQNWKGAAQPKPNFEGNGRKHQACTVETATLGYTLSRESWHHKGHAKEGRTWRPRSNAWSLRPCLTKSRIERRFSTNRTR